MVVTGAGKANLQDGQAYIGYPTKNPSSSEVVLKRLEFKGGV